MKLGTRIAATRALLVDDRLDILTIFTFMGLSRDRAFRAAFHRFLRDEENRCAPPPPPSTAEQISGLLPHP